MTDRELLELAAKAAGIEIKAVIADTFWRPDGICWDPLTNDGDALRLAVKLSIAVHQYASCVIAAPHIGRYQDCDENYGRDPYAATRRAIVRAAAEIGKAKEQA